MAMVSDRSSGDDDKYRVNHAITSKLGAGILPYNQLVYWSVFAGIIFGFHVLVPQLLTGERAFIIWAGFSFSFWLVTGKRDYKFFDSFARLPSHQTVWIHGRAKLQQVRNNLIKVKKKLGKKRVRISREQPETLEPIEDSFHILIYGEIRLLSLVVGFYLLQNDRGELRFVFEWQVKGQHPEISEEEAAEVILDLWDKGLRELPANEDITIEVSSFCRDDDVQPELDERLEKTQNSLLQALLVSQKIKFRELRNYKRRRHNVTVIRATYTPGRGNQRGQDLLSRGIRGGMSGLLKAWDLFSGEKESLEAERVHELVLQAFQYGFERYDSIWSEVMKLVVRPRTAEELFKRDYAEFHTTSAPAIPQLLILDENGIRIENNNLDLHAASVLVQGNRGKSAVPRRAPEWVYIPAHQKFVGFMQLGRVKDFISARQKSQYLFSILGKQWAHDCRIFVQFGGVNKGMQTFEMERLTRHSFASSANALKKGDVDIAATERADEAIDARKALHGGQNILRVAAGIFLYRNNPQALDRDFAELQNCFPGQEPYQETNITPRIWLQSLPYVYESFLRVPFDRTIEFEYLSKDATGLLPLTSLQPVDDYGLELISKQGFTPIKIGGFSLSRHLRMGLFAFPRSGKSVLQAHIIVEAFCRGAPVVGFDFPRPNDGTSTYYDLVTTLADYGAKAVYYDTGCVKGNMLDTPEFTHLNLTEEKIAERREQILNFQIEATNLIGTGGLEEPKLEKAMSNTVRDSLTDFHRLPEIRGRFVDADRAGIGTPQWQATPTYHDYLRFLPDWIREKRKRDGDLESDTTREADAMLVQQLRGCLKGPLANAIAQPSDYPMDTDLMIFALRNLSTNYDAAIMAVAAYAVLLRRSLLAQGVSYFLSDESPILFKFPAISNIIGQLCANGSKWGVQIVLSGQDAQTIYQSAAGSQILQTLNCKMVGYIDASGKRSIADALDFDPALLKMCASQSFLPSAKELCSNWLMRMNDVYYPCQFYPSDLLMAITANNLDEEAARRRFTAQYQDPIEGLLAWSKEYAQARRMYIPMEKIAPLPNLKLAS